MSDNTGNKLSKNEGYYENLCALINEGIAICEIIFDQKDKASDYRYLEVNPAFEKITGISADQIIGKTRGEYGSIDPYLLELFGEVVKTGEPVLQGDYSFEFDNWSDLKVYSLGAKRVAFQFSDSHKNVETARAVNKLSPKLKQIGKILAGCFFTLDPEWNLININCCNPEKVSNEEEKIIGKNIWAEYPQLLGTQIEANFRKTMSEKIHIRFEEHEPLAKDYYQIYIYPVPEGISVYFIANAERRKIEDGLRESEERYRKSIEYVPTSMCEFNLRSQRFVSVNEAMCQLLGYSREELLEMDPFDLLDEQSIITLQNRINLWLAGEKPVNNVEYAATTKEGRRIYLLVSVTFVPDKDGNPREATVIAHDITDRKQVEDALRESEAKFKAIFNASPVAVLVSRGNKHLYANPAAVSIFGYSEEELLMMSSFDIIHPDYQEIIKRLIMARMTGDEGQTHYELKVVAKGGAEKWVDVSTNLIYYEGLPAGIVNFIDITERKQGEKLLQEYMESINRAREEAEYRAAELDAIISSVAEGVVIYDSSGKIVRLNQTAREISAYSGLDYQIPNQEDEQDLNIYKPDGATYKIEELPLFRALQGEVIRDEEFFLKEVDRGIWLLNSMAPIRDSNGNLTGVVHIFNDITARNRKTEEILASERKLLKTTLDSLVEGVITTDSEGVIVFINQSAAALTGYHPDEAIGKAIDKVFYVINNQTSEPIILKASDRIVDNLVLVTGELVEIPVTVNTSSIKSNEGDVIGMVIVFQDITERQRTEQELLKTEKLQSLGILAGGIAHDFNNTLAAILANIQLAIYKLEKNEDIRTYLSNTIDTARKASDLTKQLLTFSRGGAPVKKDASLIDLIKDTAEFALRGAKTVAKYAIPDNLWVVSVDEGQISQVFHNLVINAKQAMPKGGVIKIGAENIIIQENNPFRSGCYVKITVKDQGLGIPKEHLSKIFDPFFTTKKDGNGLGLATSYSIITRHNGYLEVESREGEGTTFYIYLPALNKKVEKEEAENEVATASGQGLKILLMDDNAQILNAVGEMLENSGHHVVLTTDGSEVIEYYQAARKLNEPFDVVIMDLTVPGGLGGQEAIAHLRDFDPNIKAIVSSGYANDPIIAEYEKFGFCGFVIKPYRFDELNKVLNQVVNK
jgi:PAS domain S-box-containing protein